MLRYEAFVDALREEGHALISIGSSGIEDVRRVSGYPRGAMADADVFVRVQDFTLFCHQDDQDLLLVALKRAARHWSAKKVSIWRVRASAEITEALDEAILHIESTPVLEPPDTLLGRAVEAVTGTHALLAETGAQGEEALIKECLERKMSQRAQERALRVQMRKRHGAVFYLTVDAEGYITGLSKTRASPKDFKARFDGRDTLGCAANKIRLLRAAVRSSFGRASNLVVVDNETFDEDGTPRLNEKGIEWAAFQKKLDAIRAGKIQLKILQDGSNAGKIGYVQRNQRAERNADYYTYITVMLDTEDGYTLSCVRGADAKVLKRALKKSFSSRAAAVTVS